MDLEKIKLEQLEKQLEHTLSQAELAMIPESQRTLAIELSKNNNRLRWLVEHYVLLWNIMVDHDKMLSPWRMLGKGIAFLLLLCGGLAGIVELLKFLMKKP
jgi:hypothetical protein